MAVVSILVPVYNVRDFILRCLDSVAIQTYQGSIECILVDDCGDDDSIVLAESFIAKYHGNVMFRILHHNCNRGLAAARNTAVAAAQGQFVFHLDSDDWLEPKAIEMLVEKQEETGADIVSGAAIRYGNERKEILVEPDYSTPTDMVHNTIEMTLDHVLWRRLIRKALYTDNGISAFEGVNIGEDHHTLPRLAYYAKKIAKIDNVVYNYNCLNTNSYMSARIQGFNMRRFYNDISSIDILMNFFLDKDEYCSKRLNEIRLEYIYNSLSTCCLLSDRQSYNQISLEFNMEKSYVLLKVRSYYQLFKSKIGRKVTKYLAWNQNTTI